MLHIRHAEQVSPVNDILIKDPQQAYVVYVYYFFHIISILKLLNIWTCVGMIKKLKLAERLYKIECSNLLCGQHSIAHFYREGNILYTCYVNLHLHSNFKAFYMAHSLWYLVYKRRVVCLIDQIIGKHVFVHYTYKTRQVKFNGNDDFTVVPVIVIISGALYL